MFDAPMTRTKDGLHVLNDFALSRVAFKCFPAKTKHDHKNFFPFTTT